MPQINQGASAGRRSWWKTAWAVCVLSAAAAIAAPAQTFKTLLNFDQTNGARPYAKLVQGADGNFYGTTESGGTSSSCYEGCGTVFKMEPKGTVMTLYSFCGQTNCTDGAVPYARLVPDGRGNFYGTTFFGGVSNSCLDYGPGCGTFFRITAAGTLTTLYRFCAQTNCTDGSNPRAGLIQASDGNFYGITEYGGPQDYGTVFKSTPAGALTTLYSFCAERNCVDGEYPVGGLVQATDGNFYGTAALGGAGGGGTVFEMDASGALTTLHSFAGPDGFEPATLTLASDGNLYGTTEFGGGASNGGTVFKMTPAGTLTTLYSFCARANCIDGNGPVAGLIQATDGNLYGTTALGGTSSNGTAFRITPAGTLTILHQFDGTDGNEPLGDLLQATNGRLYGTTANGGSSGNCTQYGCGTVFSLSMGLRPFVEPVPVFGTAGKSVIILGTNLTGATSVSFSGTAAAFAMESKYAIKATVPAGATTGPVQVTLPGGTLTSNVPFRVIP